MLNVRCSSPYTRTHHAHHCISQVGVRYSSPRLTIGAISQPRKGTLSTVWLVSSECRQGIREHFR